VIGFYFAYNARRQTGPMAERSGRSISFHMNFMTIAIVLAGIGLVLWMLPALLLGWNSSSGPIGYGTGGPSSYFGYGGVLYPQWYLLAAHIILGTIVAALAVYLLLRMRWPGFPRRLAVRNFRAVMLTTWVLWVANVAIGILVFYYFTYLGQA